MRAVAGPWAGGLARLLWARMSLVISEVTVSG